MKTRHFMIAGSLLTISALHSCVKEKNLYQDPSTNPTYSELSLKLEGELTSSEMPMSRAVTENASTLDENKSIVGIALSMTSKEDPKGPAKPYAYGIFELAKAKNPENLKIRVINGYTYRISCTMIANAKDSILTEENKYGAPFDLERTGKIKGECQNKFLTAEQADGIKFLYNIDNPKITTKAGVQDTCSRPFIERYHGTIEQLDVESGKDNTIKLYRRFFGVTFKQTGLESGYLRIRMDGALNIYLPADADINKTIESDFKLVSMKNLTNKLPTDKNVPLTENVKVEVFWKKDADTEEKKIISTGINFKRNYKHNITITNIDHIGTPGNVGIDIDDEEMKEDFNQDIPWQGDNF